jgi:cobalt-zinc-cadmium resistance protein CzcA
VREAAIEVRRPTLFGELIIMIVYLPILALEGIEGKLFRPMAATVIFALLGSLLLSLTLMPVLASLFLRRPAPGRSHGETAVVRLARRAYRPLLRRALARPRAVLAGAALLLAGALGLGARLGSEFVPRLGEMAIVVNTVKLAGISLDESVRYGTRIERVLLERFPDEIERVWTRTGTAEVATDPMGLELADIFITLKPRKEWRRAHTQEKLAAAMRDELSDLPGMRMVFTQPIEMRVNEMIAGVRTDVGVKLYGDDFEVLRAKAREIEAVLRSTRGSADVFVEQVTGQPMLEVEVDRAAVARSGLNARDVLDVVEALGGRKVGEVREGQMHFDLAVRIDDAYRTDPEAIGRILVTGTGGERIPLARLARLRESEGPSTIQHEWGKRRIVVQTNVAGRDVGSFVVEARSRVAREVELAPGYYVEFGGQFEHLERARARLMVVVPAALALIFALLYASLGRVRDALLVTTGVPLAVVGGVAALAVRGLPFSISAAVGFIALFGVAVLNGLVLVSTIRQLHERGLVLAAAVEEACETRLRPVLMTALVASFGFIPMALNTGVGAEVQRPLATVVIGGILSSTLLTLVVLPVLFVRFGEAGDGAAQLDPRAPRC